VYAELGTTFASMVVTFPTVWAHLIGQLLYYMGENNIVFGSDSPWYGGPQWQIEALWRSQIPEDIRDRWDYPELDEDAKRKILGLNSARLYGLKGNETRAIGMHGSAYHPVPADYASRVPASLIPHDNFTKAKKQYAEAGGLRSNERLGWIRARL